MPIFQTRSSGHALNAAKKMAMRNVRDNYALNWARQYLQYPWRVQPVRKFRDVWHVLSQA